VERKWLRDLFGGALMIPDTVAAKNKKKLTFIRGFANTPSKFVICYSLRRNERIHMRLGCT